MWQSGLRPMMVSPGARSNSCSRNRRRKRATCVVEHYTQRPAGASITAIAAGHCALDPLTRGVVGSRRPPMPNDAIRKTIDHVLMPLIAADNGAITLVGRRDDVVEV